jgi:flagellar basal body-associated protein FliL
VEFYIALILALTLTAVAGVLYFYIMFLEARGRQQKRRIAELERANAELLEELRAARDAGEDSRELWPEVIDEDSGYSMN